MKALGVVQFLQKSFKLLPIEEEWRGILGDLPKGFIATIHGRSGHGKTEFCVRLAKMLATIDKTAWYSYEQGHGYDLQRAIRRNNMHEVAGKFIPIDPNKKRKANMSQFEELDLSLSRRGSPPFAFFDSLDYLELDFEQYKILKDKYSDKRGLIFINHEKANEPKSAIGQRIAYDGTFTIQVKDYIARPVKSRIGGMEDYVIWEEKARERNPLYFEKKQAGGVKKIKTKRPKKDNDEVSTD